MYERAGAEAVEEDPDVKRTDVDFAERHPEYEHQDKGAEGGYEQRVEAAKGVAEVGDGEAADCRSAVCY